MTAALLEGYGVSQLVERVTEAHGGLQRWEQLAAVEIRLSSGGTAFALKGQPRTLHDLTATISAVGQHIELTGRWPEPWRLRFGEAGGHDAVPLAEQLAALRGRGRLVWSVADVGTFAAAALWTYVHVPFLLADPAVEVKMLRPWREAGERWRRLAVTFPDDLATHCRQQVLYVDEEERVRRHDYTALAFGRWAWAAQYLTAYRQFDGLSIATQRRVFPRLPGGRRARWPALVWIDVHDVRSLTGSSDTRAALVRPDTWRTCSARPMARDRRGASLMP